jgi:hypothetical protein
VQNPLPVPDRVQKLATGLPVPARQPPALNAAARFVNPAASITDLVSAHGVLVAAGFAGEVRILRRWPISSYPSRFEEASLRGASPDRTHRARDRRLAMSLIPALQARGRQSETIQYPHAEALNEAGLGLR